jgi:hypothetical protein
VANMEGLGVKILIRLVIKQANLIVCTTLTLNRIAYQLSPNKKFQVSIRAERILIYLGKRALTKNTKRGI